MSSGRLPASAGGEALLSGSRTRSYGSLVHSTRSPVRERRVEHQVQPGETLQGLALKYGVTMEQIKRANRLYTNDSIFLKKSLSIPVLTDLEPPGGGAGPAGEGTSQSPAGERGEDLKENGASANQTKGEPEVPGTGVNSDLSARDFLERMDCMISQSKQAAVRKMREGEKGLVGLEPAGPRRASANRRAELRSSASSPRVHQGATLGPVPLTITKRANGLRDREDEIFQL
ncbi:lysM and putative peptidoglycan-binding domain-containing protein 1 [Lepisosteus oculatus]|uniref:lysM and putative peptidoglycan-binding domain-containing protein 1 n=1 Tax=Lepisosteus oculatus TaxID=7918 RepID=UPI00371C0111